MFKQHTIRHLEKGSNFFNHLWKVKNFLVCWETATIILLLKVGKNPIVLHKKKGQLEILDLQNILTKLLAATFLSLGKKNHPNLATELRGSFCCRGKFLERYPLHLKSFFGSTLALYTLGKLLTNIENFVFDNENTFRKMFLSRKRTSAEEYVPLVLIRWQFEIENRLSCGAQKYAMGVLNFDFRGVGIFIQKIRVRFRNCRRISVVWKIFSKFNAILHLKFFVSKESFPKLSALSTGVLMQRLARIPSRIKKSESHDSKSEFLWICTKFLEEYCEILEIF